MTAPIEPSGPPVAAPTPPDRADRASFSSRATASFAHLKDHLIPEVWALAQNVWANATSAYTAATTATTKAGEAAGSASSASASASAAGSSASASAASASAAHASELAAAASAAAAGSGSITSVNGHAGPTVTLTASDVGAQPAGSYATGTGTANGTNTGDQTLGSLGAEATANKATDFATVNHTLYPTVQAVKTYADSLVVGLLDDRGSYNASGNAWPTTGGSGASGAILKGDLWYISAAGTLGGVAVGIGDSIRALVDAPGSTAANWAILEANIGYVPENAANKDASGGYAGLTLFKLNLRNVANTITSWFTNTNTVARTYTLPDKDGTVAMTSDITGTNSGTNTGDETTATVGAIVSGATAKATPVDADMLGLSDSAASNIIKKFTWANLKTALLGTVNSWTKAQIGTPVALSVSANAVAVDLSLGNNYSLTLQATTGQTLSNPTNVVVGQSGNIVITQNATPSTLAYGSYWKSTDGTTPAVSTTAGATNVISYYVATSTQIWFALNKNGVA